MTDTRPVPDFVIRPQNHDEPVSLPTIPPERGMPTWLKVTLGLLILVGLVGGVGYLLRDTLTGSTPGALGSAVPPGQSAKAPPAPAAPPTPAAASPGTAALILENVKLEAVPGGGSAIMASGDIVNTTTAEVTPRRIRLIFKDQDRNSIGERAFELKPDRIPPLGRKPFRQQVDDPPQGAIAVDVAIEPQG